MLFVGIKSLIGAVNDLYLLLHKSMQSQFVCDVALLQ